MSPKQFRQKAWFLPSKSYCIRAPFTTVKLEQHADKSALPGQAAESLNKVYNITRIRASTRSIAPVTIYYSRPVTLFLTIISTNPCHACQARCQFPSSADSLDTDNTSYVRIRLCAAETQCGCNMSEEPSLRVLRPFWSHPSLAPPDRRFTDQYLSWSPPSWRNAARVTAAHIILVHLQFLVVLLFCAFFRLPLIHAIFEWPVEQPWRILRHGAIHRIHTFLCRC